MRPGIDRRTLAASLMALAAWPARANEDITATVATEASRIDEQAVYVPPADLKTIIDIYRRMTAPVMVNGQGPFQFVVDTGANQSVISTELAARLSLAESPVRPLNGVAGVQITPTVAASLAIADRAPRDTLLSVLPAEAMGADGMLGLDQIDGGALTLDFHHRALRIDTNRRAKPRRDEITMRAHRRDGQLTLVDADVAGIPLTAFLDSGAQNTIGNMALRALALARYPSSMWTRTPILSVTGQTLQADLADLPGLRIGGLRVPSWPVAFADLHTFRMWGLIDRPAILIGVDVLSRFETVCLDFGRDEVRFRLPARV